MKRLANRFIERIRPGFYQAPQVRLFLLGALLAILLQITRFFPGWPGHILIAYTLLFVTHVQMAFQIEQHLRSRSAIWVNKVPYIRTRFARLHSFYWLFTLFLLAIALNILKASAISPLNTFFGYYYIPVIIGMVIAVMASIYCDWRMAQIQPEDALWPFWKREKPF